jgi:Fur family ferric uptake transcriptional regulator
MSTAPFEREVEKRLAEHDVRFTRGRKVIVAALAGADGPLSAAELSRLLGDDVSLSSIYRSLAVLEEAAVLAPHHGTKGLTRHELAEWLRGHHHHLVCIDCGSVEDVDVADSHEREVEKVVDAISATASFSPINHALEIEGRCAGCVCLP